MNCFSSQQLFILCIAWLSACGPAAAEYEPGSGEYGLTYVVTPSPVEQSVSVQLTVSQDDGLLREMRFDADPDRYGAFEADGDLSFADGRVTWSPPDTGGTLAWKVTVARLRTRNGHDAWLDGSWGLFRAEDIIPRAATRTLIGATSDTSIEFRLPDGWSAITEYADVNGQFRVTKAERRFAQPSGWVVMGKLGVRREKIATTRVVVAAPRDQGVRRMDMLALLNWTLPELARVLPKLPRRLTIVSAGTPMWRGGLSAPRSIFIHADRPLISENGTSTLLHEVIHVALGAPADEDSDWIAEGLAEFYSLQLLRRSGSITPRRYERALKGLGEWANSADSLCGTPSTGATTALAVTVFEALDQELRASSDNENSLDDVLRSMLQPPASMNLESLATAAVEILGRNPDALHIDKLPGCRSMAGNSDAAN